MLAGLAFALALLCAAAIGLALQRGGTCTVAAVEELLRQRRASRLIALLEAALWVFAGLLLARALGLVAVLPRGSAPTILTILGATLLGLGAVLNRACVLGAVARLGNGEWAYAATPVGFFLGCLSGPLWQTHAAAPTPAPPWFELPAAAAGLLVLLAVWRAINALRSARRSGPIWSPHAATLAIGVAFVALVVLAGAWAYTDALADLAHGMAQGVPARLALAAAMLVGAVAGGWHAGTWRHVPVTAVAVLRCLAGGLAMAWGSLLIPGGNDGLVLLGLPLLWPQAWVAFAILLVVIALALGATAPRAATPVRAG